MKVSDQLMDHSQTKFKTGVCDFNLYERARVIRVSSEPVPIMILMIWAADIGSRI